MRQSDVETTRLLEAARARDALLHIQAYCRAPGCPAREVEVRVKDFDRDVLPIVRKRAGLHCPVCGGLLALHWVRTLAEHQAAERSMARCSVNQQIYERDHGGARVVPATVLCDDRLPDGPTTRAAERRQ